MNGLLHFRSISLNLSRWILTICFLVGAFGCGKSDPPIESPTVGDIAVPANSSDVASDAAVSDFAITVDGLVVASSQGNLPAVKLLLEAGIDVNAKASAGSPALVEASWAGRHEVVAYLLEKNADVNLASSSQLTALSAAIVGKHETIALLLIAHGADPNVIDSAGSTPLIEAAWLGNLPIVRALLANGANVNYKRRRDGFTALQAAGGKPDTMQVLRAAGAKK
jgi:hypothetical protein